MKDLIITAQRVKFELWSLFGCLIIAIGLNIYSIITYQTSWEELWTMWYIILPLAIALYVAFSIIRIIIFFIQKMFFKKK